MRRTFRSLTGVSVDCACRCSATVGRSGFGALSDAYPDVLLVGSVGVDGLLAAGCDLFLKANTARRRIAAAACRVSRARKLQNAPPRYARVPRLIAASTIVTPHC